MLVVSWRNRTGLRRYKIFGDREKGEKTLRIFKKKEKDPHNDISWLWRILGYNLIEMPRAFLEDFLNLCLRYGFNYCDIQIDEDKRIASVKVLAIELKNIKTACRMWQIRIKIKSMHGFPKIMMKYRGRWGILVGGILAVALFVFARSVIWRIDITGNERLTNEEILESLSEEGVKIGGVMSRINPNSVEQRVMIHNDDIAWISLKFVGTVARVEIMEVIDTEMSEKNTLPANLISRFDAQVVGMEVYSGFLSVNEGDYVRKGELLVSGIYKEGRSALRFSRASGRILGRVSHIFELEIPLLQEKKVYLDEKIEKKTLIFFGKSIKFFSNYRNLPTTYDIINYVYTLDPFSLGKLPISVSVDTYLPYDMREVEISEDEAIEQAYEKLRELIDAELPDAQILKKTLHGEFLDGKYILKCTVVAICDIAKQVEFEVLK